MLLKKFVTFLNWNIFQDVIIQADDEIRLKIVGTRVDATGIVSTEMNIWQLFIFYVLIYILIVKYLNYLCFSLLLER